MAVCPEQCEIARPSYDEEIVRRCEAHIDQTLLSLGGSTKDVQVYLSYFLGHPIGIAELGELKRRYDQAGWDVDTCPCLGSIRLAIINSYHYRTFMEKVDAALRLLEHPLAEKSPLCVMKADAAKEVAE